MIDRRLLDELLNTGEVRQLGDGEILCAQGEASETAFIVISGTLETEVQVETENAPQTEAQVDNETENNNEESQAELRGAPVVLGTHQAGALVGEVTALAGGQRSATLRAAGPTTVRVVPRDELRAAFDRYPDEAARVTAIARDRTDRARVAMLLGHELGTTDQQAIAAITERVTWRHLTEGEVLFEAGDPADAAFLVLSGRLTVRDPDGEVVAQIGRGGIVGEFGLLEQRSRSATVAALRDSVLAELSGADFAAITANHLGLAMGLVRRIIDRSRSNTSVAAGFGRSACVVATSAIDSQQVLDGMKAPLGGLGSTSHLSPEEVDRLLGTVDGAEIDIGDLGHIRLAELLHETDSDNDHILIEGRIDKPKWTNRSIRRADQIIVCCSAAPGPDEADQVRRLLADVPTATPTWLAVVHPPGADRAYGSAALQDRFGVDEIHHIFSADPGTDAGTDPSLKPRYDLADLARLGRLAVGKGTAVVLSGGGARGFAHIGAVAALEDHGVAIDRFVGASMGAVMGAGLAEGIPRDRRVPVTQERFVKLLDYTVPLVSLLRGKRATESMTAQWGTYDIEDLRTPFACVATDVTTAEVVHLRRGPTDVAVRASTAIPGVLPPVPYHGNLLVDGGVLDNLPVDLVNSDPSIGTIIAVDVAPPDGPRAKSDFGLSVSGWAALRDKFSRRPKRHYPGLAILLMRTMLIGSARDRERTLASGVVDLYLDLDLRSIPLLDFNTVAEASRLGYEASYDRIGHWLADETTGLERP